MSLPKHKAFRVTAAGLAAATTVTTMAATGAAASSVGRPTGTAFAAAGHPAAASHASPASSSQPWRGDVVDVVPLGDLTAAQVRTLLGDNGFDASRTAYDVSLYRLVYRTVDVAGRPTTASGLVALPKNHHRTLDVVLWAHGSAVYRGDTPSVSDDVFGRGPVLTYASAGFAAVAPDYLGQGVGPGQHPWLHIPSEVTASLDLLRAAREFAAPRVMLRPGVLATGFSQGASAVTGLSKALQDGADGYFRIRAVAPVSGAYDVRNAELPALLNGRLDQFWSTAYVAYLLSAWNRLYPLYATPQEVFREPYASTIPALFDGEHPGEQVAAGLPASVDELLTPRGRELLEHPNGALSRALRQADATCTGWTQRVPVRLYLANGGDEQVAGANATSCARQLTASGVPVTVVEVGEVDHLTSDIVATGRIVRWFQSVARH